MPATRSSEEKHVAFMAFPFASHALVGLSLLRKLAIAAPNVHFSFLNTAKSTHSLLSKSTADDVPHNIKFYLVADGVPENHVFTGKPLEPENLFLKATPENLKKGVEMAVAETGKRITCLLSDAFLSNSAAKIADDLSVPWIPAWYTFPCCLSAHIYTDLVRQRCGRSGTVDFIPGLPAMSVADLPREVPVPESEEESPFSRTLSQIGPVLPRATAVVMGFFEELNSPLLNHDLKSKLKNVLHVGFLSLSLPAPPLQPSSSDLTGCLSWLDSKKSGSVAYVGFGTLASLPPKELIAVAEALQTSGVPFLWSLNEKSKELLPKGFLEKTKMHGKVVPWTPQTQVLAHASVGVFVTHCGSNSICESIANGIPLICRPFFGDHYMIGRMIEEWGIGVRVEGGVITKNGLLKSLELVLRDEQGKVMRERAEALKEVVLKAVESAKQEFNCLVDLISSVS
ncbi:anthocyanidin 3-O-galactosyltransferase 3GT1-like [Corylus avellana]|uniref:anthocyanidin 3-O-galactosyltransferase 3GT1-like n=1 Tax=Corylus avellana TaxID=13451 RepID=UPI001E22F239|nr:anthocyanidin 3-O-galactosyltransferase 3GT1-like [Corylus avellana]